MFRLILFVLAAFSLAQASPTANYIYPFSSNTTGGYQATLYGTGFVTGATLTVGGNAVIKPWVNSPGTQLRFTVPANVTVGAWQSATITNPDTSSSTITLGIYYDNVRGCGANCGNVGYVYSGPAQTSIFACNTTLAAGNYLLTQDVSATLGTTCFGTSFPAGAVTIDLGGHSVVGIINLSNNNNLGNQVMNGTVSCEIGACIGLNGTSDTAHHLTINVSHPTPATCLGEVGINWGGTEATSSALLQTHVYNLLINMGRCDVANRTQAIRDSGANGSNGSIRSLSLEIYNVKIVWANSVSASQGLEAFAAAGIFIHNSEFVLPTTCTPCSDSARSVIFDGSFPGDYSFNKVTVIGNRAARVRGSGASQDTPLYSLNAIPVAVAIHDNLFLQIGTPGREGAITVGENDSYLDSVIIDIYNNTFELATGFGVSISAARNVSLHNNIATCYLGDCSTVGFLYQTQVPSLLYGSYGTSVNVFDNDVSVLTVASKPAGRICQSPGSFPCAADSSASLTTNAVVVNSGTTVGGGTVYTSKGQSQKATTTGTSIQ